MPLTTRERPPEAVDNLVARELSTGVAERRPTAGSSSHESAQRTEQAHRRHPLHPHDRHPFRGQPADLSSLSPHTEAAGPRRPAQLIRILRPHGTHRSSGPGRNLQPARPRESHQPLRTRCFLAHVPPHRFRNPVPPLPLLRPCRRGQGPARRGPGHPARPGRARRRPAVPHGFLSGRQHRDGRAERRARTLRRPGQARHPDRHRAVARCRRPARRVSDLRRSGA